MLILNQKNCVFDKILKACVSSWKNFSQKDAELVLMGKNLDGLTCYCKIETSKSETLGILVYVFAYLFRVN